MPLSSNRQNLALEKVEPSQLKSPIIRPSVIRNIGKVNAMQLQVKLQTTQNIKRPELPKVVEKIENIGTRSDVYPKPVNIDNISAEDLQLAKMFVKNVKSFTIKIKPTDSPAIHGNVQSGLTDNGMDQRLSKYNYPTNGLNFEQSEQ